MEQYKHPKFGYLPKKKKKKKLVDKPKEDATTDKGKD